MFASRKMEPVTAGIGFECGGSDANGGPRGTSKGGRIGDLRKNVQERLDGTDLP